MKIVLAGINYAPETTGIAPYTAGLAEALSELGHEVSVLTTFPHYPEWRFQSHEGRWTARERVNGVHVTRLRHRLPNDPAGVGRLVSELSFGARLLLARWGRPDVVIFVSPALFASGMAMFRLRFLRSRPATLLWVQDLYGEGVVQASGRARRSMVALAVGLIEASVIRRADQVVTIHRRFADRIRQIAGDRAPVEVVRNWTHLPPIEPINRDAVRRRLGWGQDEVVVLHAGNMGLKQDLSNVVEAARLVEETSPIRFVLIGDGSQRSALERQGSGARALSFMPTLDQQEFIAALQAADILLVNEAPGLQDMALPSKLTSYFAAGRPVIAATSESSVTAAEVRAAAAGIQAPAGEPHALLAAVEELAIDVPRRERLGYNGVTYVQAELTPAAALAHFEGVVEDLLGRDTSPALSRVEPAPRSRLRA